MGYYTDYRLESTATDNEIEIIRSRLEDISGYYFTKNGTDLLLYDSKWYTHHNNMIELSKLFGNIIFCLYGDGEETGDLWLRYYLNGKCQIAGAKVVYGEFNPKLMK